MAREHQMIEPFEDHQVREPCEISYKNKKGKYQAQNGITLPRL